MKILFAFENPLPSPEADAEVFTTNARYLALLAVRSWLHVPAPDRPSRDAASSVAGMPVVAAWAPARPAVLRHLCCGLTIACRKEFRQADLVYTRNLWVAGLAVLLGQKVAFDHYRPWAAQIPPLQPWIHRLMSNPRFLINICHSEYTRRTYLDLGVPEDKLACVHNGFEPRRLHAALSIDAAKQAIGVTADRKTVVYTGRVNHKKGLNLVVEAAKRLPDLLFILVGSRGEGSIEKLAAAVGNIRIVPWLPPEALASYIFAADVLLIPPSRLPLTEFGSTVLPLKVFFYMASGRPILAGNTPDIREVLRDGETAILCRPDCLDSMVAGLRSLTTDFALAARLAAAAVDQSRDLTWDARAHRIAEILARRLHSAPVARSGWSRGQVRLWLRQSWRWLVHLVRTRSWVLPPEAASPLRGPLPPRCMSGTRHRPGTDAGDGPDRTDSYRRHLGRGFNWLGGAAVIARIVDFSTILVVLLYLTKQQVGVASLVVAVGMVIEAFDGLGTSDAVVQAQAVSRVQLDTLFWFVMGASVLVAGVTLLAAPWIEAIYGVAGMAAYFLAVAIKQPLVGAALVPLAMMNRDLQYERIAIVSVCATIGAAVTRLGLAVAGAGAWALVAGYSSSGLYILLGALLARPFRPGLRVRLATIVPLVRFGLRAAASNVFEQIFKNIDYLLIGWFYGASPLAVYRVAFDVAMEPAMAVGTLVNRTALPVFARVVRVKEQFVESLTWALRRVVTLVAPLMVGLLLAADPLTALIHDGLGNSYAAAALPLRLLAAAALLRVTLQLLSPVMMGSGRPGSAARLSASTLLLLSAGIIAVGCSFPASTGIVAVSAIWLGVYPLLLVWGTRFLRRHWDIPAARLARTLVVPCIGVGAMLAAVQAASLFIGDSNPPVQLSIVVAATALTYGGLFLYARGRPYRAA